MLRKDEEIVVFLLNNHSNDVNISKIAKGLKMDYKTAYEIIKRLEKENVVMLETFGGSSKVSLTNLLSIQLYNAEKKRREDILKDKNLSVILKYFEEGLPTKLYVLLLFGSYAKKTNTKHSDIDLFFIMSDEKFESSINRIASLIPLNIHVNIFTEKEFISMKNSKEITVGSEAIKSNIILHGIESYYELIK